MNAPERTSWLSRVGQSWTRFWLTPTDPLPLHILRICTGLLFLAWLVPLASGYAGFFGVDGWFDRAAYIEAQEKNLSPSNTTFIPNSGKSRR